MRNKLAMLAVFAAFVLWAVGVGAAQQAQNQNVQITQGPRVEATTADSATIAWSTNVSASTVLKYGTDPKNLSQTAEAPWGGLTHRVTIHSLQPNTTYYFDVESGQAQGTGTGAISGVSQFKTQNGPKGIAYHPGQAQPTPGASFALTAGPIPQQVTDHAAKLWWETNLPMSQNTVKFGTAPNALNQAAQSSSSHDSVSHSANFGNLQPDTTYYYSIADANGKVYNTGSFKTEPANYAQSKAVQITNGPVIEYLSNNQAILAWTTNVPSSSVVKYGTDPNALTQTAQASWTSGTHRVTINNLQPNTKYYFQVQSAQGQGTGTSAQTGVYPFQTVQNGQAALKIAKEY